ncbi:DUF6449 domain-containing protein [Bacillus sp. Bva_UNVM-123]|uniref:DUF6449 domain-containing protein n=1 Tax=Bacillus sp. Bva_UNVM-123 TaxID=2829798 RepID=UPI00391EE94D
MHSKISLVNKEIGKIIFRSVGWISIIYFLGLFLVFPLEILRSTSEEHREYMWRENLFQFNFDFQFILSISIPVLMAIFLFRFLHVKSYSDLIHSLPVKRESVFHQYTLIGLVLLITPILANALIIIALYKPLNLADFFTVGDIFQWLMTTILFNILIFFAGVFVGMLCGISAAQGVLTYIALLLPSGMLVLLIYNLPYYLYGFPEQYFMQRKVEVFSPLVRFYFIAERPLELVEIIVYVLLLIALYGLSLFLYKNRKLEAVSQALVFPVLKPFFKYGTTFCTMLLGGMYFGQMERNTAWVIVGYLFGAVIGYFIAEMVLQKSWRIIIHIKGLLVYSGIIAVLAFLFQVDFTYYEKTVPPLNEIERVHLSSNYYFYNDNENSFFLKEVENIELISRLQKEIIANKNSNKRSPNNENAFFVYELKNGKKIVRNYLIDKKDYAHFYKFIHESDEFKQTTNPVLQVKADQIEKMTIHPNGPIYKRTVIIDPNDLQEAVSILQDEVYSATYEDTQDERDSYSNIVIVQKNKKNFSLDWRVSYKKFESWLTKKGLLDDARINARRYYLCLYR